MKRQKQPSLLEYQFAMKVAYGSTQRDAYVEVFGGSTETPREIMLIDNRASKLAGREDIASLIADEQKLKGQRISVEERKMAESIRQRLGRDVMLAQAADGSLKGNTLKGIELYLKSTGQFAPEEHILKNGGTVPGAFVPRGAESMSEDDLKNIIEAEGHSVSPIGGAEKKGE